MGGNNMKNAGWEKIGIIGTEPRRVGYTPEGLTKRQKDLRDAVVNRFSSNKVKKYITEQINYINYQRYVSDGLKILFDENGNLPESLQINDIMKTRKQLESHIQMLEAICSALRQQVVEIKEIENAAFEALKD